MSDLRLSGPHDYSAKSFVGKLNHGHGNNGLGLTPESVLPGGLLHYPAYWFDTGRVSTGGKWPFSRLERGSCARLLGQGR
jgi:hypothetical protein